MPKDNPQHSLVAILTGQQTGTLHTGTDEPVKVSVRHIPRGAYIQTSKVERVAQVVTVLGRSEYPIGVPAICDKIRNQYPEETVSDRLSALVSCDVRELTAMGALLRSGRYGQYTYQLNAADMSLLRKLGFPGLFP